MMTLISAMPDKMLSMVKALNFFLKYKKVVMVMGVRYTFYKGNFLCVTELVEKPTETLRLASAR